MGRRKYLTEESFNEWKSNHFHALEKTVAFMRGQMWAVGAIAVGIFLMVLALFFR